MAVRLRSPLQVEPDPVSTRGLTVREVARRYRVGEDKVRAWIRSGELRAINTAAVACGKSRWVIPPEALSEFEHRRVASPPHPKPRQRRRQQGATDFYPDAAPSMPSPTPSIGGSDG